MGVKKQMLHGMEEGSASDWFLEPVKSPFLFLQGGGFEKK